MSADEQHQREIWERRCPVLLARAEAAEARCATLKAALERLRPLVGPSLEHIVAAALQEETP